MDAPVPKFEIGDYVETGQQGPYDHFHKTECGFIVRRSLTFIETKHSIVSKNSFIETWIYKTTTDNKIFFPEHRLCSYTLQQMEERLAKSIEYYEKVSAPRKSHSERPCDLLYMEEQQQKQIENATFYINKYKDIIEKIKSRK
jgi:hypothetical protein